MNIRFSFAVVSLAAAFGGLIYILYLLGFVTPPNEVYMRFSALGLFITGFALLGWQKIRNHHFSWGDFYKNDTFIIFCLTVLLVGLFLGKRISLFYYTMSFFAGASIIRLLYTRKFYTPPAFFYFLFAYALLLFLGTIGTEKGFRFPNQAVNYLIFPAAFCCFRLPEKTLLQIGELFLKMGILFLAICVLYWFYNFLHLDANFTEWVTGKNTYLAQMTGWEKVQAGTFNQNLGGALSKDTPVYYPAFLFVNSWAHFYHPTANAMVLLCGLILAFYIYFQKNNVCSFTKSDLLLYAVLCLFTILLIVSRIGIVGFILITGISVLYYFKKKTRYFKIALAIYILIGGASAVLLKDKITGFANDEIRGAYRKIAISYVQDHFWWGSGFSQQRTAMEQQAEKMKDTLPQTVYPNKSEPIYNAHNHFLGDMVEFGIAGLIVLLAVYAAIAYYAIKNHNYPLLLFLCFILFFMWVEVGEHITRLIFILFFTAFCEAKKLKI